MGSVDRRKHDVDVIERVLGGVRDDLGDATRPTHVVDLHLQNADRPQTVELIVGLVDVEPSEHIKKYGRR